MPVVLQFDRPGSPTVLEYRDIATPEPGPGEVLYRVLAFGLNRADILLMADVYYNSPVYPARLGHDAAGIVEAVGSGVTRFRVGDYVSSIAQEDGRYGVNGEIAITPEDYVVAWPKGFNALEACSVWSSALTSYYSLVELVTLTPGDTVLITAASSTAGTGAIQMAKLCGARVIATSRGHDKTDFLRAVGADHIIVTETDDVADEIRKITNGRGVNVVFDMVSGAFVDRYVGALAKGASVHLVGAVGGDLITNFSVLPLVQAGATITGFSIFNYSRDKTRLERAKTFILDALNRQQFKPIIDRVYDFADTVRAYEYMQAGSQKGKIVVRVSPDAELRL
ncbi:zinc-dependent alcohol dehydrogenase family protein [Paraburkholderia agricolaris]|uniref:Zinc-dependent alcohol dehydrogenase family protein n=2 Tax=Paraburkholderia agricolaris TaxID=2152888 RepID=A0ABW8ZWX3_9BURK